MHALGVILLAPDGVSARRHVDPFPGPAVPADGGSADKGGGSLWANIFEESQGTTTAEWSAVHYTPPKASKEFVSQTMAKPRPPRPLPPTAPTVEQRGCIPSSADSAGAGAGVGVAHEATPYVGGAQQDQAEICRLRGNEAFKRRDLSAAERWYDKALQADATNVAALNNLAACHLAAAPPRPHEAMVRLRAALTYEPLHTKARLRAGRCCIMLGELDAAEAHFETVLRAERPSDSNAEPRRVS